MGENLILCAQGRLNHIEGIFSRVANQTIFLSDQKIWTRWMQSTLWNHQQSHVRHPPDDVAITQHCNILRKISYLQ